MKRYRKGCGLLGVIYGSRVHKVWELTVRQLLPFKQIAALSVLSHRLGFERVLSDGRGL